MIPDDPRISELSRRGFIKALGASLALAGLDGCTRIPAENILPHVDEPPELTPGVAAHYATSMVLDGYATGLIVEAHEGRPTKIEGNPHHPASLGATGMLEQASLLQLYDPDRAGRIRRGGSTESWRGFAGAFAPAALAQRVGARGAGLALLLEPTSSPMIAAGLDELRTRYPDLLVCCHTPLRSSSTDAAFTTAGLVPHYDIGVADVILSVGSNFLAEGPFNLRHAHEFADRRRTPTSGMNRLYVAESTFSVTGGAADHRLPARPDELETLLASILSAIRGGHPESRWAAVVAEDLQSHPGRSLVIAGDRQAPRVHALAAAINDTLGNTGRTVWFARPALVDLGSRSPSIADLVQARIDTLVCIGGNPAYTTPGSMRFSDVLRKIPNTAYLGLYENETAHAVTWFVPELHYLEQWGDARAYDGTYSLVQPLVQPLHEAKSAADVLAALAGRPAIATRSLLREIVFKNGVDPTEDGWARAVGTGVVASPALARAPAIPRPELLVSGGAAASPGGSITVVFDRDARVHDGAFANNGWLQELPDPITKLTWGNAALLGPATAARLGVATGDVVQLSHAGASLRLPAIVVPGHANETTTIHFGYGRTGHESTAAGVGVDVYALWPRTGSFVLAGVSLERAAGGDHRELAITQTHWTMDGRGQAREETLASYASGRSIDDTHRRRSLTIYDPPPRLDAPQQWAMTIDLGTCIGCSACVVAC